MHTHTHRIHAAGRSHARCTAQAPARSRARTHTQDSAQIYALSHRGMWRAASELFGNAATALGVHGVVDHKGRVEQQSMKLTRTSDSISAESQKLRALLSSLCAREAALLAEHRAARTQSRKVTIAAQVAEVRQRISARRAELAAYQTIRKGVETVATTARMSSFVADSASSMHGVTAALRARRAAELHGKKLGDLTAGIHEEIDEMNEAVADVADIGTLPTPGGRRVWSTMPRFPRSSTQRRQQPRHRAPPSRTTWQQTMMHPRRCQPTARPLTVPASPRCPSKPRRRHWPPAHAQHPIPSLIHPACQKPRRARCHDSTQVRVPSLWPPQPQPALAGHASSPRGLPATWQPQAGATTTNQLRVLCQPRTRGALQRARHRRAQCPHLLRHPLAALRPAYSHTALRAREACSDVRHLSASFPRARARAVRRFCVGTQYTSHRNRGRAPRAAHGVAAIARRARVGAVVWHSVGSVPPLAGQRFFAAALARDAQRTRSVLSSPVVCL